MQMWNNTDSCHLVHLVPAFANSSNIFRYCHIYSHPMLVHGVVLPTFIDWRYKRQMCSSECSFIWVGLITTEMSLLLPRAEISRMFGHQLHCSTCHFTNNSTINALRLEVQPNHVTKLGDHINISASCFS